MGIFKIPTGKNFHTGFLKFKVSKMTRKTSEVCKKPVLQNEIGGCYIHFQFQGYKN